MIRLKYGNTNTFFIQGDNGGLLVDTDYAGTLLAFYKAIKSNSIGIKDISYTLATHYHPDHVGLISELMKHGIGLLLVTSQIGSVHYADRIFIRDKHFQYCPIDETKATVISCEESRSFLRMMGINGEIISTPSHSEDSVSLVLDSGDCFVGDLEPIDYLAAYEDNPHLKADWNRVISYNPKRIFYAHANERII